MCSQEGDHCIEVWASGYVEPVKAAHDFLKVFSSLGTEDGGVCKVNTVGDSINGEALSEWSGGGWETCCNLEVVYIPVSRG